MKSKKMKMRTLFLAKNMFVEISAILDGILRKQEDFSLLNLVTSFYSHPSGTFYG